MRYGLPYQGSKNKLAERIVNLLPEAEHFYDVFAGGCAVSHAALSSGKFGCVHFSDINDSVALFRDCLEGNIPDGSEWISRDEFFSRKDTDPYVRLVWSFGNNQKNYLYSQEIEPYKKAVHEMIFAPTPNERRLKFREVCKLIPYVLGLNGGGYGECQTTSQWRDYRGYIQTSTPRTAITPPHTHTQTLIYQGVAGCTINRGLPAATNNIELNRLQSEERRRAIQELPFFGGEYEMRIADYRDIDILPNSVIYCDIPYKGTANYLKQEFDYETFYKWCECQTAPVFISEYWMPEDRFKCIAQFERKSTFSSTSNTKTEIEKIYIPIHQQ